jgi:DNA modification methylase
MSVRILIGDCRSELAKLPDKSVHCCVTSPPYFGLRDYGVEGQMGLEPTPDEFVAGMVEVFREVRRVLRDDGTLWLNIGDSYATQGGQQKTPHMGAIFADRARGQKVISRGKRLPRGEGRWGGGNNSAGDDLKPKDLIGIPWLLAFALRADGWYLRQEIIWSKPNPMPESVRDRCTKSHEQIFLLSKSPRYYFDQESIREGQDREPDKRLRSSTFKKVQKIGHALSSAEYVETVGANRRSVWEVTTQPFSEAHFATFPPTLIKPCILAGCPEGGTVLDPFGGAGTTGMVADRLQRNAILIELNPEYAEIAQRRLNKDAGMFAEVLAA